MLNLSYSIYISAFLGSFSSSLPLSIRIKGYFIASDYTATYMINIHKALSHLYYTKPGYKILEY